jgi:hypothetical protein
MSTESKSRINRDVMSVLLKTYIYIYIHIVVCDIRQTSSKVVQKHLGLWTNIQTDETVKINKTELAYKSDSHLNQQVTINTTSHSKQFTPTVETQWSH